MKKRNILDRVPNFLNEAIKNIAKNSKELDEKIDQIPEPADTPDEIDKLTYSKKDKGKQMKTPPVSDTGLGTNKSVISEIEAAWKKNKASDDPEETVMENIEMTKASIKSIVKHANALAMGLNESNQSCLSEGWIQSKITIIEDYLKAVHDYVMYYEEEPEEEEQDESYAAQQKFGGKKRSDLKDSDFLFPETKSFPIVTPQDVKHAISNFGRMKSDMSYDSFLKKLYNFCKRKGSDFVSALPKATKDRLGIKDEK